MNNDVNNSVDYGVILTTVSSQEKGLEIANSLLIAKLAACINIFPIESLYLWQGKIERDAEWQLIIKTRLDLVDELITKITSLHDYEVPEIIVLEIACGSKSYLEWLGNSLKSRSPS